MEQQWLIANDQEVIECEPGAVRSLRYESRQAVSLLGDLVDSNIHTIPPSFRC